MLKRDDPAWAELIADIKAVVSRRCEDGFAFASLHRTEQWDFFTVSGFSDRYADQGITDAQVLIIVGNALDGKPQDKWLEGVFDRDIEKVAFQNILRDDRPMPRESKTQERGGREM